jgi:hypothetical protein
MIPPPTHTHFLENYFAEVKIKNDHMIDKMEDRVKHAVNKYDNVLIMWLKTVMMVMWFWDYFPILDREWPFIWHKYYYKNVLWFYFCVKKATISKIV